MIFCLFAGDGSMVLTRVGADVGVICAVGTGELDSGVAVGVVCGVPVIFNAGIPGRLLQPASIAERNSIV